MYGGGGGGAERVGQEREAGEGGRGREILVEGVRERIPCNESKREKEREREAPCNIHLQPWISISYIKRPYEFLFG